MRRYIQAAFSFAVAGVETQANRLRMESRLISAVSACDDCQPSRVWPRNHSPKPQIRDSGLWLVNELYKEPLNDDDLRWLQRSP